MNENFNIFLTEVLKHEGGYVNHPKDSGGPTNLGVTLVNFRKFVKPDGTVEDLKKLTKEQAGIVFRRNYWDVVLGAELPSGVDFAVGDYAVNSGPSRPVKALQKIVGITADGKIGPITLEAVRKRDPKELINALCDERLAFMKVARNKETKELLWPTFGKGWQKRVDDVRAKSLSLVGKTETVKEIPPVLLPPVLQPTIPVTPIEQAKPATKNKWLWPVIIGIILVVAAIAFI